MNADLSSLADYLLHEATEAVVGGVVALGEASSRGRLETDLLERVHHERRPRHHDVLVHGREALRPQLHAQEGHLGLSLRQGAQPECD